MAERRDACIQSPLVMNGLQKFIMFGIHRCMDRAVFTFAELGIADLMASQQRPMTAAELSQLNGNNWNAENLYRLLRTIAGADIVKELPVTEENSQMNLRPESVNRFELTDNGLFLTSDHPSKARDVIRLDLGPIMQKQSEYQSHLIRNGIKDGNGFQQAFGCSLFDYLGKPENKEYSAIFNNGMISYSYYCILAIKSLVNFSPFEKVVDFAGGVGSLLSIVLAQHKHLKGIVFDLAHVIEDLRQQHPNQFEEKHIEPNRYEFIAGDMFKPETIPKADAYLLKFIIHDWNDEDAIKILKSIRSANKSSEPRLITIFLIEIVILPNDRDNWIAHVVDMEMLTLLSAKERTKDEYIKLLKESGYEFKEIYRTDGPFSIIEATTMTDVMD